MHSHKMLKLLDTSPPPPKKDSGHVFRNLYSDIYMYEITLILPIHYKAGWGFSVQKYVSVQLLLKFSTESDGEIFENKLTPSITFIGMYFRPHDEITLSI